MKKIIKGMIVVGVMVFAMLAFAGCGKKRIHLNDYFSYSIEGYDGIGNAIASFDDDAFSAAVLAEYKEMDFWTIGVIMSTSQCPYGEWSKKTDLSNGEKIVYHWLMDRKVLAESKMNITADDIEVTVSGLEEINTYDPFQDAVITFSGADGYGVVEYDTTKCKVPVTFTSTKKEKLSNGDTVTISYSKSKDIPGTIAQYGAALIGGSKEFNVEGLEALKEFDPFENLVITYTGTSPLATMVFDTKAVPVPDLYYYCEDNDYLANGDTKEIKVKTNTYSKTLEEQCALYGFKPTREKKTIEVAGADEWLQKVSDIPEAVAKRIDKVAEDYMISSYDQELESYKGLERIGLVVCDKKSHDVWDGQNYLYYVFKVTVITKSGQESSYYFFLRYSDVKKLSDGTVVLDEDDYNYYCTHSFTLPDFGSVYGYSSLDAFFADNVLSIAENFTYDTNLEVG